MKLSTNPYTTTSPNQSRRYAPCVLLCIAGVFGGMLIGLAGRLEAVDDVNWGTTSHNGAAATTTTYRPHSVPARLQQKVQRVRTSLHLTGGTTASRPQSPFAVRDEFEKVYPPNDLERIHRTVQDLRKETPSTQSGMPYNVMACPDEPPVDYPVAWNILTILHHWNPDNTTIPADGIYQSLCVFDWQTEQHKAERYRELELPFVVTNHPEVLRAAERWTTPGYLERVLGDTAQRNEHSTNTNHLMFWRTYHLNAQSIPKDWKAPTEMVELTYADWLTKAQAMEQQSGADHTQRDHWYFRLNGGGYNAKDPQAKSHPQNNPVLFHELPMFIPEQANFFLVEPTKGHGINCRFGMKGAIAEAHFDPTRNFILVLGGQRRYILTHPDQCENLELYPLKHPSGRHSRVDWSVPPPLDTERPFGRARAQEVVLQAGDALYLPTSWFHFIVSLNRNYQCNARSGTTYEHADVIADCGFG